MLGVTRVLTAAAVAVAAFALSASAAMAAGAVYTLTNASDGNQVAVFDRAPDGTLAPAGAVSTGGLGSGSGLGSQGALVLDGRRLFAVNAGSNEISLLRARAGGLELLDVEPSGGVRPISVTAHGNLVYALNEGSSLSPGNISGFVVDHGDLVPLAGSTRPLSAPAVGPAQVEFTPDGGHLVVTEKNTNRIVTYEVGPTGVAGPPNVQPSAGQTPFGFAFDSLGRLIVSEAFGGAPDASAMSSYSIDGNGDLSVIDPSVPTTETAACWVVVTRNGKFAYTTNTGSGSISGYAVEDDGGLTLLDADGRTAVTGPGSSPIDMALSKGSKFLYVLNAGSHTIAGFRVEQGGSLQPIGSVGGLAPAAVGLAAK